MKQIQINISNHQEPIPFAIKELSSTKVIIFINGDGDIKESFYPIIKNVEDLTQEYSLACFSFRGRETDTKYPHKQLILDLEEILQYLIKKGFKEINILCTSSGFVSTAFALSKNKYAQYLKTVVLLDPADYPLVGEKRTWAGNMEFTPTTELVSDNLKNIPSTTTIHTIFFAIKSWNQVLGKIVKQSLLNTSNPNHLTRMNIEMTKNIHKTIPEKSRGEWIEDKTLPHAFERDYNVKENQKIIAQYVYDLIVKHI